MKKFGAVPVWLLLCLFGLSHATERVCSPALPTISDALEIPDSLVQMSSSMYFAGFALGIVILGRLSDITGRRPLVLMGLGIYAISAILCSHVEDGVSLLFFRFTQAFGASVGSVLAQAMARDSYEGRSLAQVYVGVAISLSFVPSMGLILGGYSVEYLGWESNFWILGICAITLLTLCSFFLPETNKYAGIQNDDNKYFTILKKVVTDKKVMLYALIVGCTSGMTIGFYVEAPFIFIDYLKMSPSEYGMIGVGIAAANLIGGLTNRFLVKRHICSYKAIRWGVSLSLFSSALMFLGSFAISEESSYSAAIVVIVMPSMLHALGHTFTVPHILHFALEEYRQVNGTAGSIFGSMYYMIVAIISYAISRIPDISIPAFATLFLTLSMICAVAYQMIRLISFRKNLQ